MKYIIDEQTLNLVANYLASRSWAEVNPLIARLSEVTQHPYVEETKETKKNG